MLNDAYFILLSNKISEEAWTKPASQTKFKFLVSNTISIIYDEGKQSMYLKVEGFSLKT